MSLSSWSALSFTPQITPPRTLLVTPLALLWVAVGAVTAGGCNRVDCAGLCERVRRCRPAVTRALVERQPSKSRFMNHVRAKIPERMVPRLLESCSERCDALGKNSKWQKKLKACAAIEQCDAFARCIAPALEP